MTDKPQDQSSAPSRTPSFNPKPLHENRRQNNDQQYNRNRKNFYNNNNNQNRNFHYVPSNDANDQASQNEQGQAQNHEVQQQIANADNNSQNGDSQAKREISAPPPPVRFNAFNFGNNQDSGFNNHRFNNYHNNNRNDYNDQDGEYQNRPNRFNNTNPNNYNHNYNNRRNYHNNRNNYNNNNGYNNNNNNYRNNNNFNRRGGYNNNRNPQNRRNNYNNNNNNYNNNQQSERYENNNFNQVENTSVPQNAAENTFQPQPAAFQITPGHITSELRQIFCLMSDEIISTTSDEEILRNPNIGVELLGRPLFQQIRSDRTALTNVPMNLVDFLIEGFAVDQPEDKKFNANKIFSEETVMTLQIPIPLPLSFESPAPQDKKTLLGFFNTESSTAEEAQLQVTSILNTLAGRQKTVYTIESVDRNAFSNEELTKLKNDCNVVVLRDDYQLDEQSDLVSFTLHVLHHDFESKQDKVNSYITEMFERARIYKCPKCRCFFCPGDGSRCEIRKHKGKMIPFPNEGVMEIMDYDEEADEPICWVWYECCGECIKGEPGCQVTCVNMNHDTVPDMMISSISTSVQSVYVFD